MHRPQLAAVPLPEQSCKRRVRGGGGAYRSTSLHPDVVRRRQKPVAETRLDMGAGGGGGARRSTPPQPMPMLRRDASHPKTCRLRDGYSLSPSERCFGSWFFPLHSTARDIFICIFEEFAEPISKANWDPLTMRNDGLFLGFTDQSNPNAAPPKEECRI